MRSYAPVDFRTSEHGTERLSHVSASQQRMLPSHKQSPSRHLARRAFVVGICSESVHSVLPRLKSAKNLYLSHRFFCKIRQIHSFFNVFRQNLQILCRNQAPPRRPPDSRRACIERATWRETPSTSSVFAQETRHPHEMDTGLKSLVTCTRLTCTRRSPYQRQRRSRPCRSSP